MGPTYVIIFSPVRGADVRFRSPGSWSTGGKIGGILTQIRLMIIPFTRTTLSSFIRFVHHSPRTGCLGGFISDAIGEVYLTREVNCRALLVAGLIWLTFPQRRTDWANYKTALHNTITLSGVVLWLRRWLLVLHCVVVCCPTFWPLSHHCELRWGTSQ